MKRVREKERRERERGRRGDLYCVIQREEREGEGEGERVGEVEREIVRIVYYEDREITEVTKLATP